MTQTFLRMGMRQRFIKTKITAIINKVDIKKHLQYNCLRKKSKPKIRNTIEIGEKNARVRKSRPSLRSHQLHPRVQNTVKFLCFRLTAPKKCKQKRVRI